MSKNDITGDRLINKANSKAYSDNWDAIFNKYIKDVIDTTESLEAQKVGHSRFTDDELFGKNES